MGFETWKYIDGKKVPSNSIFSNNIFKFLKKDSKILDLGCGYGRISEILSSKVHEVYGIDINKKAILEAKKNPNLKKIKFSVQDGSKTKFKSEFFDAITFQAILGCTPLKHRIKILKECHRILKPKGIIQIAEFGRSKDLERYLRDEKITKEYGTMIVKNSEGYTFWSHNFDKKELELLLEKSKFKIKLYKSKKFKSMSGKPHPGHIIIVKKI